MRIGISVMTHAGQNIWENGLGQNIFFLANLFRALPFVEDVIFLNCGDQEAMPPQASAEAARFRLLRQREATDLIDIAIEMGGALDLEWVDYMRALGKRVVLMRCGLSYVSITEPNVFSRGGYGARPDHVDEVWTLPMDEAFHPMLRVLYRCEVRTVPYIWSPMFLEKGIAEAEAQGLSFGFQARTNAADDGLRAAIFEPNISVVKSGVIPMLICDAAQRRAPGCVAMLNALNTMHMTEHPTLNYLANSLDLVKQHKAVFLAREAFPTFMAGHADLVVSHQWRNEQNYLYLDALWGGYPLVHNSPWIADLGYYYPDFDIDEGAAQVIRAYQTHAADLESYRARARSFIATLDPLDRANRDAYARRLLRLTSPAAGETAA